MDIVKDLLLRRIIYGSLVGDALGVPYEFRNRASFKKFPAIDMIEYKVHNQPIGTYSDDGSLLLCLAESIVEGYDAHSLAVKMVNWMKYGYLSANGNVFDIGNATGVALRRYDKTKNILSGGLTIETNGNGSLMRILPAVLFSFEFSDEELKQIISEISSITHGHIISTDSCLFYVLYAKELIITKNKFEAFENVLKKHELFSEIFKESTSLFRIKNFWELEEEKINSSGYVIHTLEAAIWCFLNLNNYKETVLKSVNLGEDTDTTACVSGGIAGIYYGIGSIPEHWLSSLKNKITIEEICNKI